MHPYTFFIETPLLENWIWGCISSVIITTILVCVLFGLPSLLSSSIYLVAFYTCIYIYIYIHIILLQCNMYVHKIFKVLL